MLSKNNANVRKLLLADIKTCIYTQAYTAISIHITI